MKQASGRLGRKPHWRMAIALCETPAVVVAATCLLSAGAAFSIATPTCYTDQNPIPSACDRANLQGSCPGRPITDPPCGDVDEVSSGSTEFTTYDQRTCTYQPQKYDHYEGECVDDEEQGPVTTGAFSCKAEHGSSCPQGGGGPQ